MPKPPSQATHNQIQLAFDQLDAPAIAAETVSPKPNYQLTRSRRKTLSICVDAGELIVRAPQRANLKDIEQFLYEKKSWIDKQFAEDAARQSEKLRLFHNARFTVLGQEHTLQILAPHSKTTPQRASSRTVDHSLIVQLSPKAYESAEKHVEKTFGRWLKTQVGAYMESRSTELAEQLHLAAALGKIRYRITRSKWGHCTAEGDLQFNPCVALAPMSVVDYIVAHEVCHLKHRNHSQRFWQLVERVCPDWREAEHWLKTNGHRAEFYCTNALR